VDGLLAAQRIQAARRERADTQEILVGDKSPKSKERGQQQKNAVKKQDASNAAAKQQRQASPSAPPGKKK
jgi:hypothetical protein